MEILLHYEPVFIIATNSSHYRPQTKLRKGYVLHLSVILSTGGVCPSACWDTPWADTPLTDTTPQADTPHTWADTPWQTPPPPGQTPASARRLLLRTVRILLECILACVIISFCASHFKTDIKY